MHRIRRSSPRSTATWRLRTATSGPSTQEGLRTRRRQRWAWRYETASLLRCHFILKNDRFYQDRLWTNTGKTHKEMRVFYRWSARLVGSLWTTLATARSVEWSPHSSQSRLSFRLSRACLGKPSFSFTKLHRCKLTQGFVVVGFCCIRISCALCYVHIAFVHNVMCIELIDLMIRTRRVNGPVPTRTPV